MFIIALFTIAKTWKQLKYPLVDEWIKKTLYIYIYIYIHTMENYSAIKRNEIITFSNLAIIILNEVGQKENDKYHMISFVHGF